jgi:AcrR family transcriptional regulator
VDRALDADVGLEADHVAVFNGRTSSSARIESEAPPRLGGHTAKGAPFLYSRAFFGAIVYNFTMAGRRTQAERREETRAQLLVAAREVFGRRGFGGATLDEISDAAGLSRGALYYYFPEGKEQLFLALLDERIAERARTVQETFAQDSAGPADAVGTAEGAAAEAEVWMVGRENREWRLLFFEFVLHAARDPHFSAEFLKREQGMRDALAGAVESTAAGLGGEAPIPPAELATGINALANGLALDALIDEGAVPEHLFSTLIGFLVRGMVAAGQEGYPKKIGGTTR